MANLIQDRKSIRKDGALFYQPVAATTVIYAGSLVNQDSSGYAVPAADDATHTFCGKADAQADNVTGAAGDINVEGHREGLFSFNASGMTQADINEEAYVVDDNTIGLGIASQPVNVTGVVAARISATRGGSYALAYTNASTLLAYGGGTGVDVSSDGDYTLTAPDGSQLLVTVTSASLPGSDQSDTLTIRSVKCGRIAEVTSATSVFIDIMAAARA